MKKAGAPALTTSVEASPGGRLLLAQRIERTFSYLVQYSSFPRRIDVLREVGTGSAQAVTGG